MFLVIIAVLLIAVYWFVTNQYAYWENVGVASIKPKIPFGNIQSVIKRERSFGTAIYDLYKQSSEPFVGVYLFFRPALLIRDAKLVKTILTTDFQYFHDRGVYSDPKNDPMSSNLFALTGETWKSLRAKLTPAFTSGKLKGMFPTIQAIGDELVRLMQPIAEKNQVVEIRDYVGRFTLDCLATIAFGQDDISTLKNPDHDFRMIGKKLQDNSKTLNIIRAASTFLCPGLLKFLRLKGLPGFMRDFCLNMVTKTIEERERNNIVRKDLMQCLIQLRNNSDNKADADEWKIIASGKALKSMTYEEIAANIFIFYIAGNETSSSTVAYTLYELTQNEELMYRAQEDIKLTLEKHQGEVNYESIMDMKFIDLCVKETLRKYPFPLLNRECTKDYQIPGSKFTVKKGTAVIISLLGLHRDEKFFPNPEKYDPDRFTEETKAFDEDMYMPFGGGPRNCIAFRMGLVVAKTAIVKLLKSYNFEAISKKELEFDFGSVALTPKPGQLKVKIMER